MRAGLGRAPLSRGPVTRTSVERAAPTRDGPGAGASASLHCALDPQVSRLFTGLTGFRFDVLPAPPPPLEWDEQPLLGRCRATAHRVRPREVVCRECARRNLQIALRKQGLGHAFQGRCGRNVFLLPMPAPRGSGGVLVLRSAVAGVVPKHLACHDTPADAGNPGHHDLKFHRAMLLLRVLAAYARMRTLCNGASAALARQELAFGAREREIERLRRALERAAPAIPGSRAAFRHGTRSQQAIHLMVERIQRDHASPLTLSKLARELGMNASYVSALFARQVGMPFKSYLTALRIQRARELLSDPRQRVGEVATLVGYASAGRFRAAFRAWTGLSPSRWREVLRVG